MFPLSVLHRQPASASHSKTNQPDHEETILECVRAAISSCRSQNRENPGGAPERRTNTHLRMARKHRWFVVSAKASLPPGRARRRGSRAPGQLPRRGGSVGTHSLTFSVEVAARQERRCWTKRAGWGRWVMLV